MQNLQIAHKFFLHLILRKSYFHLIFSNRAQVDDSAKDIFEYQLVFVLLL